MPFKAMDILGITILVDYNKMLKQAGVEVDYIMNPCSLEATEDELITAIGDADAVVTQNLFQPFTRKVLSNLGNLKFSISVGVGYDKLDVDAATELGIMVANVPDLSLEEVSDHAMALILACTRRVVELNNIVKSGGWKAQPDRDIGSEIWPKMFRLRGKTLGLIAFGRIPRALTPKAKGFGLRILAYDPYIDEDIFKKYGVERVTDLDELLAQSDVVSVHAPLNAETRHMVGLEQLQKMKPSACLVNTARGPVVDHEALYTTLSQGGIAAAAFDVTEPEPIALDNPLLKLDNFIVTPHSAHAFSSSHPDLPKRPVEEIIRVVKGEWPVGLINKQVKEKYLQKWSKS